LRALPCAYFRNVAQRFAIVHEHDVTAALIVFSHAKLSVIHADQRAKLNSIPLDKKEHPIPCLEFGNGNDLQSHPSHLPAQKSKADGRRRGPF